MADELPETDETLSIEDRFADEALMTIEHARDVLVRLSEGVETAGAFDDVARAIFSLNGAAEVLDLDQIKALTRSFCNAAMSLRDAGGLDKAEASTLLAALDTLVELIEHMRTGNDQPVFIHSLVADLDALPNTTSPLPPSDVSAAETQAEVALEAESVELENVLVDNTHQIHSEDFRGIVESFVVEATEILDNLDTKLLILEEHYQDKALIDEIFRDVHTVKGSAGFMNLQQLSHIAHHFEDVLDRLRRGGIEFHPAIMDVIFEAYDHMKVLALQVKNQKLAVVKQGHLIKKLSAISAGTFKPETAAGPCRKSTDQDAPRDGTTQDRDPASAVDAGNGRPAGGATANRALDRSTETIRVEVFRLDTLLNLVGELVLNRNRLVQITKDLSLSLSDELERGLLETSAQLDFITTALQTSVMHTRMVPIGRIFNTFPRVVRDLARSTDKEIELVVEGAETELDKSLTDEIGNPLVHLLRNSIDHGIEVPATRIAAGKPPVGTIRLVAMQESNNIIIEVSDDGAGINVDRVKRKAIEKNLITEAEAAEMSEADAFLLLFEPGFSTAETISSISGRGVGMDVVKTHIARLNGTIAIHSVMGKGSSVTLKLPLTLAIK